MKEIKNERRVVHSIIIKLKGLKQKGLDKSTEFAEKMAELKREKAELVRMTNNPNCIGKSEASLKVTIQGDELIIWEQAKIEEQNTNLQTKITELERRLEKKPTIIYRDSTIYQETKADNIKKEKNKIINSLTKTLLETNLKKNELNNKLVIAKKELFHIQCKLFDDEIRRTYHIVKDDFEYQF